jgi:hypothetical protein
MKELSGLLDQNRHKRTLLFIGAGFSFGALNRMGEPVPLGNSLRDALLRKKFLWRGQPIILSPKKVGTNYSTC